MVAFAEVEIYDDAAEKVTDTAEMRSLLGRVALEGEDVAQAHAPVLTGTYRDSIDGGVVAAVKPESQLWVDRSVLALSGVRHHQQPPVPHTDERARTGHRETGAYLMKLAHRYHDLSIGRMAQVADDLDAMMALTNLTGVVSANMLNQITNTGAFLSIHTGNGASVGQTGATEIIGSSMIGYSSGGYTGGRKSITWNTAGTDGVNESNIAQTFGLLASQASGILGWGLWTTDGSTAGTFLFGGSTTGLTGSIPNGANVVFAAGGIVLTISG